MPSLQLGTLKFAIFASSEVSFLRFSFGMGKGTDSSVSSFILVQNRKLLEMLGSLSESQGSPCPPKYRPVPWEWVMERAKSAGSGKAGRCRCWGAETSPCRPLLSVPASPNGRVCRKSPHFEYFFHFSSASTPPLS